jgi:uncharacterized protein (UPF0548 family)
MRLRQLLDRAAGQSLTYDEVGGTSNEPLPRGYHHVRAERILGHGNNAFTAAVEALRGWAPQRGSGLSVIADGPIAAGTNVAMAAPLPIGFTIATCRVVYVGEEENCFAFAYGTLKTHPERGEERFEVARSGDAVVFRVIAFSAPQELLSRIASPVARKLQAKATTRYLDAMRSAIA